MDLFDIIGKKISVKCDNIDDGVKIYNMCIDNNKINCYGLSLRDVINHINIFGHIVFHICQKNFLEYGNYNFYDAHYFEIIKFKEIKDVI